MRFFRQPSRIKNYKLNMQEHVLTLNDYTNKKGITESGTVHITYNNINSGIIYIYLLNRDKERIKELSKYSYISVISEKNSNKKCKYKIIKANYGNWTMNIKTEVITIGDLNPEDKVSLVFSGVIYENI